MESHRKHHAAIPFDYCERTGYDFLLLGILYGKMPKDRYQGHPVA